MKKMIITKRKVLTVSSDRYIIFMALDFFYVFKHLIILTIITQQQGFTESAEVLEFIPHKKIRPQHFNFEKYVP